MLLSSNITPCRVTNIYLTQEADSELVIHQFDGSRDFRINAQVAYIWQLCNGGASLGEITETVRQIYPELAETAEQEVSDTISELFSHELLDFNSAKVKPFASIAFSDWQGEFNGLHSFFIKLFGEWFDLHVVGVSVTPDIYINTGSSHEEALSSTLRVCVSETGESPGQGYDFVFTSKLYPQIPPETNLLLPATVMSDPSVKLLPEDHEKIVHVLGLRDDGHGTPPSAIADSVSESTTNKKLTIGMATYDDYDGVYFSVQAIRMYHPEVTDETEILVIDNNPSGPCAKALRDLEQLVPGYRYIAVDEIRGTAVRDFVFREANTDYVMCMDSHVFIEPGALRKLIDYFDHHPGTKDLLQGPLLSDDLKSLSTHFEPAWRQGMFGFWSLDQRGIDPAGEPFDIPMQGLGIAACRKDAWQGYNPRFSGFGGEEGYIHQKFRNAGARTLCLPFLRWMHRFNRPMGTHYTNKWEDRIRNYLIGFDEVGLNKDLLRKHFTEVTSREVVDEVTQQVEDENSNPFNYFDAIYCINLDQETGRWEGMKKRLEKLGIGNRVRRLSAVKTPESGHIGCALSHRKVIEQARKLGCRNVLVLEDDALFHDDTLVHMRNAVSELEKVKWNAFYLGGMKWGEVHGDPYMKLKDCTYLEKPELLTCTHAIAYNSDFFDTLLKELPDDISRMKYWLAEHVAIDQYLTMQEKMVVMTPVVATQANIMGFEDETMREGFN